MIIYMDRLLFILLIFIIIIPPIPTDITETDLRL